MAVAFAADSGSDETQKPLTPFGRVLATFTSPNRAFAHLGSGGSWWLPYLLLVVVSLGYAATIGSRVTWETATRNTLAASPKQQARIDQLPPAQQGAQVAAIARITRTVTYITSVAGPLIFGAIIAGLLLLTLNFGLGGHARYGPMFAVYFFSALPQVLKLLLVILILFLGGGGESFLINNPLGSNPAFYLQGSNTPRWLISLLSWADAFVIWQIVLLIIGSAIVAKLSRGKTAAAVLGWTFLFVGIGAAIAGVS